MGVGGGIVDGVAAVLQLNQFLSAAGIFLGHVVRIVAREIVGTFSTGNNISNDDLYITFFRDNKFLIYRQDADILSGSYDIDEIGGTIIARIIGTDGTTYLAICIKSSLIVLVRTDTVDSYELTKISKKPMIIGHSSDMITE